MESLYLGDRVSGLIGGVAETITAYNRGRPGRKLLDGG